MSSILARSKFLFDADFGARVEERPVAPADHARRIAEAESRGYRDGFAAAERERIAAAEMQTAAAMQQIGDALSQVARSMAEIERRHAAEAVQVAATVGRKLAPALVKREPFAEIEALAADCLRTLVATPHVVVRVHDSLHAVATERLNQIAREQGFAGRLLVMAEPDIAPGDCRMEWADGGLTRNHAQIDTAIGDAVARYIGGVRPASGPGPKPQASAKSLLGEVTL